MRNLNGHKVQVNIKSVVEMAEDLTEQFRQEATEWWESISVVQQMRHAENYFTRSDSVNLSNLEVEHIWFNEVMNNE